MMRKILEALGAGFIVYVTMAACSSAGGSGGHHSSGGTAGGGGAVAEAGDAAGAAGGGGTQGVDGSTDGNFLDAIGDALTDPVPDATANESGTRLKARRYVANDGAKHFLGWYDTKRAENCSFILASDSKVRCLPLAQFGSVKFTDSGCSSPVALFPAGGICPSKTVARFVDLGNQCSGPGYAVYDLGSQVQAPTDVYEHSNGQCIKQAVSAGMQAFQASLVPPTEFVAAQEQVDP